MPNTPLSLHATIELSLDTDRRHTRERCPTIHFIDDNDCPVASFPTDCEQPRLALPDESVASIDLDRVISRVIDEEAWLGEMRRVLTPSGKIRFTVPASGPFAWLDTRNIYRYLVDIMGRGDEPDDTLPTGWHRHYSQQDLLELLAASRLHAASLHRIGTGLPEIPQLAGLIAGNMIGGDRTTELRLHALRVRMEKRDDARTVPLIGSSFAVTATPLP